MSSKVGSGRGWYLVYRTTRGRFFVKETRSFDDRARQGEDLKVGGDFSKKKRNVGFACA